MEIIAQLYTIFCGSVGVMCGECSNSSYGVSALLNNCVNCHDASGLLIVFLSEQL